MKTPPKKKNNGKKTAGAVLWLAFLALIGFSNTEAFQNIRLPRFAPLSDTIVTGLCIAAAGVLVLALVIFTVITLQKKNAAASQEDCHNRLHPEHAAACADRMTHWKRQLDGFLEAGLIDKAEYKVLMERYSRETNL